MEYHENNMEYHENNMDNFIYIDVDTFSLFETKFQSKTSPKVRACTL